MFRIIRVAERDHGPACGACCFKEQPIQVPVLHVSEIKQRIVLQVSKIKQWIVLHVGKVVQWIIVLRGG